jgi:hypothetical protein
MAASGRHVGRAKKCDLRAREIAGAVVYRLKSGLQEATVLQAFPSHQLRRCVKGLFSIPHADYEQVSCPYRLKQNSFAAGQPETPALRRSAPPRA